MIKKLISPFILIGTFITIYPLVFLLVGSFMHPAELQENLAPIIESSEDTYATWSFLPMIPTLRSYVKVLLEEPQFFVAFWNSVKIVIGVELGQLFIGVPAAWGFARYQFKFKNALFFLYIIMMMLPFQVIMLSEYLVLNNLGLIDSLWAIILPGMFSTFPVFVVYNFFRGIPESILEAARLDGANEFEVFFKIGIPLGKTGIIAALVLQFLEYWNVVEQPIAFIETQRFWPLTLYLPSINLENAGQSFVSAVIALVPAMLVFFSAKKHLEKGIVATAVKE